MARTRDGSARPGTSAVVDVASPRGAGDDCLLHLAARRLSILPYPIRQVAPVEQDHGIRRRRRCGSRRDDARLRTVVVGLRRQCKPRASTQEEIASFRRYRIRANGACYTPPPEDTRMAIVSEHAPGAPSWFELATSNQEAGEEVLHRSSSDGRRIDNPMGPDGVYTMFQTRRPRRRRGL